MTEVFSRRIVGWRVANTLRAALALDALEEAAAGFHGEQVTLGFCGVRWCRAKDGDVRTSGPGRPAQCPSASSSRRPYRRTQPRRDVKVGPSDSNPAKVLTHAPAGGYRSAVADRLTERGAR
jgi:transposase InsO family protein